METRDRITQIIARQVVGCVGFSLGNPDPETWPILPDFFGTQTEEGLRTALGDDFRSERRPIFCQVPVMKLGGGK